MLITNPQNACSGHFVSAPQSSVNPRGKSSEQSRVGTDTTNSGHRGGRWEWAWGCLLSRCWEFRLLQAPLPSRLTTKDKENTETTAHQGEVGRGRCLPVADRCSGTLSSAVWLAGSSLQSKWCVRGVLHERKRCKIWDLCMHSTLMQLLKCTYEKYQQLNCEGIAKQLSTKKINWHAVIDASM